jgi:hypothetical protein
MIKLFRNRHLVSWIIFSGSKFRGGRVFIVVFVSLNIFSYILIYFINKKVEHTRDLIRGTEIK